MAELRLSGIKDKLNIEVKEKDIVNFFYNEINVNAEISYINEAFIVHTPNNNPISCRLAQLKEIAGDFEIVGDMVSNMLPLGEIV